MDPIVKTQPTPVEAEIVKLWLQGLSKSKIRDSLGVKMKTINRCIKIYSNIVSPDDSKAADVYSVIKGIYLDKVEKKIIEKIERNLDKAPVSQLASALATISNMNRLEKGLSTQNISEKFLAQIGSIEGAENDVKEPL